MNDKDALAMRPLVIAALLVLLATACADEGASATTTIAPISTDATTATTAAPETTPPTTVGATSATPSTTSEPRVTTTTAPVDAALRSGTWIAVLASLEFAEYDAAAAQAEAAAIGDMLDLDGLEVDVLSSDDYASLSDGFWVVHLGGFRDEFQADQACSSLASGAPDCYTRYLTVVGDDQAVGYEHGNLLAVLDNGPLAVIDMATGAVVRTNEDVYYGDGSFPNNPTLAGGGTEVYYSVGFEDYWFDCDASDGTLVALNFADGEPEQVADGFSPVSSPDGGTLLYLASSECIEDPNEPQFVLAPIDTVVMRDLATGDEERVVLPLDGDVAGGFEFSQATWGPGGSVVLVDTEGGIYHLDGEEANLVSQLDGFGWWLVGYHTDDEVVVLGHHVFDGESATTDLVAVDLSTGDQQVIEVYEGIATASLDSVGLHLVIATEDTLIVDGVTISVSYRAVALAW